MSQKWLAITSPGLEKVVYEEIRALGGRKAQEQPGGILFEASNRALYSILNGARTPNRIYLRVDEFRARDLPELYRKTRRIDWSQWLTPNHRLEIHAYTSESQITHTGRMINAVSHAIDECFTEDKGATPPLISDIDNRPDAADLPVSKFSVLRLVVRLEKDYCCLNLDASGELFKRSWRGDQTTAPIRESYAASLLKLAQWDRSEPLIDPMAGSGTIPIEAWTIAHDIPPGVLKRFAIMTWANFKKESWPTPTASFQEKSLYISGLDADGSSIDVACKNRMACATSVARGLSLTDTDATSIHTRIEKEVIFKTSDVSLLTLPSRDLPPGLMITNAPYGVRLKDGTNAAIRTLVKSFLDDFHGWRLVIILHRDFTPAAPPERCTILADFRNGGIPVRVWCIK